MTPDSEYRPSGADSALASVPPQVDATETVASTPLRSGTQKVSGIRRAGIAALGLASLAVPGFVKPDSTTAYTGSMLATAGSSPVDCDPDTLLAQAQAGTADVTVTTTAIQDPNCPPTGENTTQVETEGDEVDQRLNGWLDGSFRTDLKIDEFFTHRGRYLPLNITDPEIINFQEDYEQSLVPFQGVFLTRDTVPSDNGQDYDVYYFGLEGKNRERFFIGVNVGRAAEDATTTTGMTRQEAPNKPGDKYVSTLKLREQLDGKEGEVMLFTPSAAIVQRTVNPKFRERFDCMIPQQPLADDFIRNMAKVTTEDLDIKDIPADSLTMQYVVNQRIEKYIPENTLFSAGITEMQLAA